MMALAALAVATIAWLQSPDALTGSEAVAAAEAALDAAGVEGARVDPDPELGRYTRGSRRDAISVWKTSASVDGGELQLWLAEDDGEPVFLDDRAPDGSTQMLTEAQFRTLADHSENPAADRWVRRNIVLTVAAAAVALVAVRVTAAASRIPRITFRRPRMRPRRRSGPIVEPPSRRRDRPLQAQQETW